MNSAISNMRAGCRRQGQDPAGRKVSMKKILKLAAVAVLASVLLLTGAGSAYADEDRLLQPYDTLDWHYYLRKNGIGLGFRTLVLEGTYESLYCMNPDKKCRRTPYSGIGELGSEPVTTAMVYCMMNGPKRYDGTSCAGQAYTTGDFRKDYYITQVAIWCLHAYYTGYHGPGSTGTPDQLTPDTGCEDIWQHVSDLYTDAIAYAREHPDGYEYGLSVTAEPSDGDGRMHLNADCTAFEKSIDVTWTGNGISSSDITCQLANAPEGTEWLLTEKDEEACRAKILVRVPVSAGIQAGQSILCNVKAEFGQWRVRQLIPPLEELQTLMCYTNVIPESLMTSAELSVPTGHIRVAKVTERPAHIVSASSLKGAVYEVRDQLTGETVGTLTTDEQGMSETLPLREGVYSLREVSAPEGYGLDEREYSDILIMDQYTAEHPLTVTSVEPILSPPTPTPATTPTVTPTPAATPTVTPTPATTPTVTPTTTPAVTPTITHPVTPTEIVREPEPKKTKAQTVTTKPADTGDRENILSLVLLMVGAGGLIGLLAYVRGQKRNS